MIQALELLYSLGALDDTCKVVEPLGTQLAEFPVEPRISKMLICQYLPLFSEKCTLPLASVGTVLRSSVTVSTRVMSALEMGPPWLLRMVRSSSRLPPWFWANSDAQQKTLAINSSAGFMWVLGYGCAEDAQERYCTKCLVCTATCGLGIVK